MMQQHIGQQCKLVVLLILLSNYTFGQIEKAIFSKTYKWVIKDDSIKQQSTMEFWTYQKDSPIEVKRYSNYFYGQKDSLETYSFSIKNMLLDTSARCANCIREIIHQPNKKIIDSHFDLKQQLAGYPILLAHRVSKYKESNTYYVNYKLWNKQGQKLYHLKSDSKKEYTTTWYPTGQKKAQFKNLCFILRPIKLINDPYYLGAVKVWHPNGQLHYKVLYREGAVFRFIEYNNQGKCISKKDFDPHEEKQISGIDDTIVQQYLTSKIFPCFVQYGPTPILESK